MREWKTATEASIYLEQCGDALCVNDRLKTERAAGTGQRVTEIPGHIFEGAMAHGLALRYLTGAGFYAKVRYGAFQSAVLIEEHIDGIFFPDEPFLDDEVSGQSVRPKP
jgi:hypothetical protein